MDDITDYVLDDINLINGQVVCLCRLLIKLKWFTIKRENED